MVAGPGELMNGVVEEIVHARILGADMYRLAGQLTEAEQANARGGAGSAE